MKIEKVLNHFQSAEEFFRCPICHKKMKTRAQAEIACNKGHCFDLSNSGYINFLPHQKATKYSKELFENRRFLLENGYYQPLTDQIKSIIEACFPEKRELNILDAGCGEGFYSRQVSRDFPEARIFAFDNVKDAVVMGAKSHRDIWWFVGDLTNIPMMSGIIDVILDIFTPSNYGEFTRLLGKNGYILKVIPGEQYLKELKACVNKEWRNKEYSNQPVIDYFVQNMTLIEEYTLSYTIPVDHQSTNSFLKMTPMMFDVLEEDVNVEELTEISFEFIVLLGKSKE